ncbi:unnamed protein product [Phyllotreta striolata]|uniref:Uncharacterized protein n=1 Tax=Phyllotreta striolata TaxID=444603 RepID=A0A9N9TGK5_PHYSR|nr:unnamed protein product [Phyllotreta striolata]
MRRDSLRGEPSITSEGTDKNQLREKIDDLFKDQTTNNQGKKQPKKPPTNQKRLSLDAGDSNTDVDYKYKRESVGGSKKEARRSNSSTSKIPDNESNEGSKQSVNEPEIEEEEDEKDEDACKEEMGRILKENNDKICDYICNLRTQRDDLVYIIEKQYEERKRLETEMERITYKLCLINKSMAQRIKAKCLYDQTIDEVEEQYSKLVKDSGTILALVQNRFQKLDGMINKTTSTDEKRNSNNDQHTVCNCCKCREKRKKSMDLNGNRQQARKECHPKCDCIFKSAC